MECRRDRSNGCKKLALDELALRSNLVCLSLLPRCLFSMSVAETVQAPTVLNTQTIPTGSKWLEYKRDTLQDSEGR